MFHFNQSASVWPPELNRTRWVPWWSRTSGRNMGRKMRRATKEWTVLLKTQHIETLAHHLCRNLCTYLLWYRRRISTTTCWRRQHTVVSCSCAVSTAYTATKAGQRYFWLKFFEGCQWWPAYWVFRVHRKAKSTHVISHKTASGVKVCRLRNTKGMLSNKWATNETSESSEPVVLLVLSH